jgi:hypothetical protein
MVKIVKRTLPGGVWQQLLPYALRMMKKLLLFICLFSTLSFGQADNYRLMVKETMIIDSKYELLYAENPILNKLFEKTMKYRLDPSLGKFEYITAEELQGVKYFDRLQVFSDKENVDIYKKYMSQKYVEIMIGFNEKRKQLRSELMSRKITWRQFADSFEDLIIKLNSNKSEFREKIEVETELS